MKHRVKKTLREIVKYFGVKVKFVHYFDAETQGKLIPREKIILINAHQPRTEHIFTVLHEIGHYVLHVLNPNRRFHPRWCDLNWKGQFMVNLCSKIRRYMRFNFRKEAGREWEADTWAMLVFWLIARDFGGRKELSDFLDRHPEKMSKFILVVAGVALQDMRRRIKNLLGCLQPCSKYIKLLRWSKL